MKMKWLKKFFKIGRFNKKKQYKADKTSTTTTSTTVIIIIITTTKVILLRLLLLLLVLLLLLLLLILLQLILLLLLLLLLFFFYYFYFYHYYYYYYFFYQFFNYYYCFYHYCYGRLGGGLPGCICIVQYIFDKYTALSYMGVTLIFLKLHTFQMYQVGKCAKCIYDFKSKREPSSAPDRTGSGQAGNITP